MNKILKYRNANSTIDVRFEDGTVWLTQKQMVLLFETTKQNISLHINNVFRQHKLDRKFTVKEIKTAIKSGNRIVNRKIKYYNLNVINYLTSNIKNHKGDRFLKWAEKKLK